MHFFTLVFKEFELGMKDKEKKDPRIYLRNLSS